MTASDNRVQPPDVLPVIRTWLEASHAKVSSFWINNDWHGWATIELFMALENHTPTDERSWLVLHGVDEVFTNETDTPEGEFVGMLVSASSADEGSVSTVALKVRCEEVSENEGSFERFVEQMEGDRERIERAAAAGLADDWGGKGSGRVMLIGFSSEGTVEVFKKTRHEDIVRWETGDVFVWVMSWKV